MLNLLKKIYRNLYFRAFHFTAPRVDAASLDRYFVPLDKQALHLSSNLLLMPDYAHRIKGKYAYIEWGHVLGIFQTLINFQLQGNAAPKILDVGCGTGFLAIASFPYIQDGGAYCGIDVSDEDIRFCRQHFNHPAFTFQHLDVYNAAYARQQPTTQSRWDIPDASQDLVTALSVWTHFNETDSLFYFREVERVLKPGGRAIITAFLLDERYEQSLPHRTDARGKHHLFKQNRWIFSKVASASGEWRTTQWTHVPEGAIGMTPQALDMLLSETALTHLETLSGSWKESPGVFFQDVLIFEKR